MLKRPSILGAAKTSTVVGRSFQHSTFLAPARLEQLVITVHVEISFKLKFNFTANLCSTLNLNRIYHQASDDWLVRPQAKPWESVRVRFAHHCCRQCPAWRARHASGRTAGARSPDATWSGTAARGWWWRPSRTGGRRGSRALDDAWVSTGPSCWASGRASWRASWWTRARVVPATWNRATTWVSLEGQFRQQLNG